MAYVQTYPAAAYNAWPPSDATSTAQQQYAGYPSSYQYPSQASTSDPYAAYAQQYAQQQQYSQQPYAQQPATGGYVYSQPPAQSAAVAPQLPAEAPPPLPSDGMKVGSSEDVPPPPPGEDAAPPPPPPAPSSDVASTSSASSTVPISQAPAGPSATDAAAAEAYNQYYSQQYAAYPQYDYSQYYAQQQQQQHQQQQQQQQYAAHAYWQSQQQQAAYGQQPPPATGPTPGQQQQQQPQQSQPQQQQQHIPGVSGVPTLSTSTAPAARNDRWGNPVTSPNGGKKPSGGSLDPFLSFNAVPPPSHLAAGGHAAQQQQQQAGHKPGFAIKAQWGIGRKAPGPVVSVPLPTPAAFRPEVPKAAATAAPAYTSTAYAAKPAVNSTPAVSRPAAPAPSKFPGPFSTWVERCFGMCRTDAQRQTMTARLSEKIKECNAEGRMWSIAWDVEPLLKLDDSAGSTMTVTPVRGGGGTGGAQYDSPAARSGGKRDRWGSSAGDEGYSGYGRAPGGAKGEADVPSWRANIGNNVPAFSAPKSKKQKKAAAAAAAMAEAATLRGAKGISKAKLPADWSGAEKAKLNARAGRFGDGRADGVRGSGYEARRDGGGSQSDDESSEDIDFSNLTIKGTCNDLEKSFFRLTDAPDPSTVRPEPVLEQALARLVGLLRARKATYFYALDQFKGMRQDCTVQHLRNSLAVRVYEAHARSSLEYGDMAEFNQCQTQLHAMYALGVSGCRAEFVAYKLIYQTVHARRGLNKTLLSTMQHVAADPTLARSPEVVHALQLRSAVMTSDTAAFFRLYASAPNLGRALMDGLALKVRWNALNVLMRACGKTQNLPVAFLANLLGFMPRPADGVVVAASAVGNGAKKKAPAAAAAEPLPGCCDATYVGRAAGAASDAEGYQACVEWLQACSAVVLMTGGSPSAYELDMKAAVELTEPVDATKVAHGDENLSMEDFLAKAAVKATMAR